MTTLIEVATIDKRPAKPAPHHFTKLLFACQARRLDQANSTAIVMDVVKLSKTDMVHLQKHSIQLSSVGMDVAGRRLLLVETDSGRHNTKVAEVL